MIFPPEIWEHIFLYADPVALTNLKTVCKCWNLIIEKILKENTHWYRKCKMEIPQHLWSSLCEKLHPSKFYVKLHEKQDSMIWMAMYKLWLKCENLVKYDASVVHTISLLKSDVGEHVTCASVCENLLAVGTSEGYIFFYDISNFHKHPVYVADHKEYVENVQFLRDEKNIVAVSCSINNHISFWDFRRKRLIDKKRGKLICTSYGFCYTAMYNVIVIEGSIPRIAYTFSEHAIVAIAADNDKVHFYTEGGEYFKFNLGSEGEKCSFEYIAPPDVKVRRYYMFKPDIMICITEFGYVGILNKNKKWELHNVFSILHGTPTTILVYSHLFIVGLDSGSVHIYYLEDLESLDLSSTNSKQITLDSTAVISLDLITHLEEYLIVAYKSKICIVKFS